MIKRDFRYIIKRILIGVGICLSLSFINSCDVKALSNSYYKRYNCSGNNNAVVGDSYTYEILNNFYKIEYKSDGIYVNDINFYSSSDYLQRRLFISNPNNSDNVYIYLFKMNNNTQNFSTGGGGIMPTFDNYPQQTYYFNGPSFSFLRFIFSNGDFISQDVGSSSSFVNNSLYNIYASTQQFGYFNTNGNFSGYCAVSKKDSERSNVPVIPQNSLINSLGIVKNKNQEENVITSYTFHPTFTNFNTDNFTYQYKIGNNNWLNITTNNVSFNVNQNTTVYFRVLKKSDNSLVDSQTFTITNILKYNDNVNENYNVKYTSENKSVQEESSINRTIDTVTVNFEYFPKQSNLKYQYQYVKTGDSLSTWIDMPSQDYERGYTVNDNGTLYNRILDQNDTVLYTSTFTVDSVGKLMFDSDISWYNSLFNKINYGSGIGTIFYLPLKIVQTVHDSYSETCNPVNLGALLGTTLYMPCIDIKSLIGSNLYNIIDIIFMGFIALSIIRFIVNVYNRIISLNFEGNDDGSGALFL